MTRHKRSLSNYSGGQIFVGALLFLPAAVLLITAIYLLVALVGAIPLMLIWNHGLTTFLGAAGLGTVAKIGFWEAFRIGLLGAWVAFLFRSVGNGFTNKSDD